MATLFLSSLIGHYRSSEAADLRFPRGRVLGAYLKNDLSRSSIIELREDPEHDWQTSYLPTDVTQVIQTKIKIVGRGLRNRNGETIAFACIGAQDQSDPLDPTCDFLRAVYYNPQSQGTFAFGRIYAPGQQSVRQYFKSLHGYRLRVLNSELNINHSLNLHSDEITSQTGWNWANQPLQISYSRFFSMVEQIEMKAAIFRRSEYHSIYRHMIQPAHPSKLSPWYIPGVHPND